MVRLKIARGAVLRSGPILIAFLTVVVGWLFVCLALMPTLGVSFTAAFPAGMVALAAALLTYMNLPGYVHLGSDGVLLDWRGKTRYVPFADVQDVAIYKEDAMGKHMIGVGLKLRTGEEVRAPIGENQFGADKRAKDLEARLRAALTSYQHNAEPDHAPALARGDRSDAQWLERLRSVGQGANANMREAPVPLEQLWRIVECASAEPTARAGAAVALRVSLDNDAKTRLRVAADCTAEPALRRVLETAAADDEDRLTVALSRIDR